MGHARCLAFTACCVAWIAAGCLNTTDETFAGYCGDAGDSEGCHELTAGDMTLVDFDVDAPGMDPPVTPETDGGYCQLVLDCVCGQFSGTSYDACVQDVEFMSETECRVTLEQGYPECLP
jgi:hypothetical protein